MVLNMDMVLNMGRMSTSFKMGRKGGVGGQRWNNLPAERLATF